MIHPLFPSSRPSRPSKYLVEKPNFLKSAREQQLSLSTILVTSVFSLQKRAHKSRLVPYQTPTYLSRKAEENYERFFFFFSKRVKLNYPSGKKFSNIRRRRRRSRCRRLRHVFPAPFRLSVGLKSQVFHGRNIVRQRREGMRGSRMRRSEGGGERGGEGGGSRGEVVVVFGGEGGGRGLKETPTIQVAPALFSWKVQCHSPQQVTHLTGVT